MRGKHGRKRLELWIMNFQMVSRHIISCWVFHYYRYLHIKLQCKSKCLWWCRSSKASIYSRNNFWKEAYEILVSNSIFSLDCNFSSFYL